MKDITLAMAILGLFALHGCTVSKQADHGKRPAPQEPAQPTRKIDTSPPSGPYDLRGHRGNYSLLIETFVTESRREICENRVKALRAKNVEAYYYHGEKHSLVTIGTFNHDQAWDKNDSGNLIYSRTVKDEQERFPLEKYNGKITEWKSGLVKLERP